MVKGVPEGVGIGFVVPFFREFLFPRVGSVCLD